MGWGRVLSEGGLMKSGKIAVALQSYKKSQIPHFHAASLGGKKPSGKIAPKVGAGFSC